MADRSVIVIGAGVVGLCSGYYLAKRGFQVTILDAEKADNKGCSYGNAGMIVPSHIEPLAAPGMVAMGLKMLANPKSPFWIRPRADADLLRWMALFTKSATAGHVDRCAPVLRDLNMASRDCFEGLESEIGKFDLQARGLLMLCAQPETWEHEQKLARRAKDLGLKVNILSAKEAKALETGMDLNTAGAVHFLDDRHLDPVTFMAKLKASVQRLGVKIEYGCRVSRLCHSEGKIASAMTDSGERTADEFVMAAGSWSPELAKTTSLSMPMQAGKGYSFDVPAPVQMPTIPSILVEGRVAVTPLPGRLRFSGTMEITGNDLSINAKRIQGICESIPKYYPRFDAKELESYPAWAGLRPCSPDGMPYIGRPKHIGNLCVATGHSMMGMSLGPITGKLVSEVLTEQSASVELSLLSPDRFG